MLRTAGTVLALWAGLGFVSSASAEADPKDPNTCRALWSDIGLPERSGMTGDTTYVCRQRYIVEHNDETKTPDWVIERLARNIVRGTHKQAGHTVQS